MDAMQYKANYKQQLSYHQAFVGFFWRSEKKFPPLSLYLLWDFMVTRCQSHLKHQANCPIFHLTRKIQLNKFKNSFLDSVWIYSPLTL